MGKPLEGLWIINAEAITVYASDEMAEILGTIPLEMKGQPSFDYLFPEDVAAAQHLFEAKMRGIPRHSTFGCGERMAMPSGSMYREPRSITRPAYSRESWARSPFQGDTPDWKTILGAWETRAPALRINAQQEVLILLMYREASTSATTPSFQSLASVG